MEHIDHKKDDNIDNRRRWNRNGRIRVQLKQSFRLAYHEDDYNDYNRDNCAYNGAYN